jgi:hypothetical protein
VRLDSEQFPNPRLADLGKNTYFLVDNHCRFGKLEDQATGEDSFAVGSAISYVHHARSKALFRPYS